MGDLGQLGKQLIPHGDHLFAVRFHIVHRLLQGRRHGHDPGHILGAGPLAPLLGAALDQVEQGDVLPAVQGAYALGSMELVAGDGQHIDVHLLHIDGHVARRLHRVGVEGDALLPAQGADLRDGLHGTDLVVGEHDGHQAGVLPDGCGHILQPHHAVLMHVQQGDLIALFLQTLEGVQHRVMLKLGRDQVLFALARAQAGSGHNGLVVGLAAAGGEVDFPGAGGAQAGGHGGPGLRHGLGGLLGEGVEAGGVAVILGQVGQHGVQRGLADAGGSCVISIYKHGSISISYYSTGNYITVRLFVNGLFPLFARQQVL